MMHTDPTSGRPYWSHAATGQTQWEDPNAGVAKPAMPAMQTPQQPVQQPMGVPPPVGTDPATGKPYWLDPVTGQTTWNPPAAPAPQYAAAPQYPPMQQQQHPGMVMQQQPGQMQMIGVAGMVDQVQIPVDATGKFSSGLCSCFDKCGICCMAAWCPCISLNQLLSKGGMRLGDPCGQTAAWIALCCIPLVCGCPPCCCFIEMQARTSMRTVYNIMGGGAEDFCVTWCCPFCALTQEHRHIDKYPIMLGVVPQE